MKEPLVKFKAEFAVISKKICNISQNFFFKEIIFIIKI